MPDDTKKRWTSVNDDEPFLMLAFKIMNDPFVGSLTFCRIYSGVLEAGSLCTEHSEGQERTCWSYAADAFQLT